MKKFLAVILAACICFTFSPAVFAETEEVRYSIDGGTTWKEASLMDALWATYGKGNIKIELLRDIILDSSWYSQQDIGYNGDIVELDGKGFTIKRVEGAGMLFCVRYGCDVTFKNITIDGGAVWSSADPETRINSGVSVEYTNSHLIYVDGGATLTFESGTILQNCDLGNSMYGAAVCVGYSDIGAGKLVMKEGSVIRNNRAQSGGAVFVDDYGDKAVFEMQGGEIYGNYATSGGGAIFVNSGTEFNMTGGKIYNNASGNNGGGVTVNGTFTMSGGEIYSNKSVAGGGGVTALIGIFNLNGGAVRNNSITGDMGGGVLVYSGSMSVSGSGSVYGNTKNGTEPLNVYLSSEKTIAILGKLTNTEKIGVTAKDKGVFTDGWDAEMKDESIDEYFSVDTVGYVVDYDDNSKELRYGEGAAIYFNANGGEGYMAAQTFKKGTEVTLPKSIFVKSDSEFIGWATEKDGEVVFEDEDEMTINEDTELFAVWKKAKEDKPKNESEHKKADAIIIDINASDVSEEDEENPNTGAPVF